MSDAGRRSEISHARGGSPHGRRLPDKETPHEAHHQDRARNHPGARPARRRLRRARCGLGRRHREGDRRGCGVTVADRRPPAAEEEAVEEDSGETAGQENARRSAESYLSHSAFSRSGLIHQLKFEGYSTADATYGVDAVSPDWNEQAAKSAESYLSHSAFSRSGLIDQLKFEGYTAEQATYGVGQAGL